MRQGVTLVELMIALAIASILVLAVYRMHSISDNIARSSRESWYCMQALRTALLQLDQDLTQCAYLLPQDLKITAQANGLFIGGVPATADHAGLQLNTLIPPPYYAVMIAHEGSGIRLDTVDIDNDQVPDYWADLGLITDAGAYVIAHTYTRGNTFIPLKTAPPTVNGARVVPAVHYELRGDGLYRDGQILAEGIDAFEAHREGRDVAVYLRAHNHGTVREIQYRFTIG